MALDSATSMEISLAINGHDTRVVVDQQLTLLQLLRDKLYLTGAKEGCGVGECGACSVIMNGRTVNACLVLAVEAAGAHIETIEGEGEGDELSALQDAFVRHGAIQCGFCTPGMIMSARELLRRNPRPDRAAIVEAISGNLCRCTGYLPIIDAISEVAARGDDK